MTPDPRSLTDQLHELRWTATERGMYDASAWLEQQLRKLEGLSERPSEQWIGDPG